MVFLSLKRRQCFSFGLVVSHKVQIIRCETSHCDSLWIVLPAGSGGVTFDLRGCAYVHVDAGVDVSRETLFRFLFVSLVLNRILDLTPHFESWIRSDSYLPAVSVPLTSPDVP